MTAVKRVYYVCAPDSDLVHMADTKIEGNKTHCGKTLAITVRGRWTWFTALSPGEQRVLGKRHRCKRCFA